MDNRQSKGSLNRKAAVSGFFYVLVQVLVRGITFLTTPVYTRLVSTEQYGVIRIYESWLLIAVPVMSLCLYRSVYKAKFDFGDRFNAYVSSAQTLSCISTLAIFAVITLFFRRQFMAFTGMSGLMYVYMLLFVITYTGMYFFQYREKQLMRYKRSVTATALAMFPATALSILLLYWGNRTGRQDSLVHLRVIGFYTPQILVGFVLIASMLRDGRTLYRKEYWKYALLFSVPLIPEVLSIQIMNQSDKIMIQKMVGDASAGIFALGTTVSFIIWILEDAVWGAWQPWMYEKINREETEDIEKPWISVVVIFGLVSWALVALAPEIILILGGKKYMDAIYLIAPMVTGTLFRFCSYGFSVVQTYHKKTQYVAAGTIGVMFVNVALNYVCILFFGYRAAAYTTTASYFLLLVVQGILEKKVTGQRIIGLSKMIATTLAIFAVNAATMLTFSWKWYFRYAVVLAVGVAALVVFLPTIRQFVSMMKKSPKRSTEA